MRRRGHRFTQIYTDSAEWEDAGGATNERNLVAAFSSEPGEQEKMKSMFGPGQVDQSVRQAIQMCWMMLPDDARRVEELEKQFRRIVDRALADLREDAEAFGLSK